MLREILDANPPIEPQPGFEKQAGSDEGAQNCRAYNEKARLLTLRHAALTSSAAVNARWPLGLWRLVRGHYERRGGAIIQGVELLLEPVASVTSSNQGAAEEPEPSQAVTPPPSASAGFLRSLGKLLPKLRSRFAR